MESIVGIDRRRPLPELAPQKFSEWFAGRSEPRTGGGGAGASSEAQQSDRPAVGLFIDTFTEYHYPEVGIAATRVLEVYGYRVRQISGKCCGRPMISKGLLDRAIENARENLAMLDAIADRRIPVVGLEPSCLLTFRDEYPDLLPGADAKRVAQNCFLLEEFLSPDREHPNKNLPLKPAAQKALFHGHCHLKALVGSEPSLRFLRGVPGLEVQEIDSGCCGMAGSFGFEKEHYDVSMAIAERRLAPAVRALPPDALIVAGGVSCRQQILHTTGRQPLHPAEVMERAVLGS
jgi:Fe-S oxidoreductase